MQSARKILAVGLLCAVALAGCGGLEVKESGFLKDYSLLKPSDQFKGTMVYVNPAKPAKLYDKFIVDPIVVHFAPDAKGGGIDPETLNDLATYFHTEVTTLLSEHGYEVVKAAGPGVLLVRAAITQIDKTVPIANIHPATKLSGIGLGGASMEAEGLDSQTNELVFAVTDSQKGSRLDFTGGFQSYGNAKSVMKSWAERFVARLDEAHGRVKK